MFKLLQPIDFAEFAKYGENFNVIPLAQELLADQDTPLTIYEKLTAGNQNTFLLESAENGGLWSRYSFIGINSSSTIYEKDGALEWEGIIPAGAPVGGPFLESLLNIAAHLRSPKLPDAPPLTGGLVGYLGYDIVRQLEKLPVVAQDQDKFPQSLYLLVNDLAVYDHLRGTVTVICNAVNWDGKVSGIEAAYQDAAKRLAANVAKLSSATKLKPIRDIQDPAPEFTRLTSPADFCRNVIKLKEDIRNGEAFQIVLSQKFEMQTQAAEFDIYRSLRLTNPSPYMFFFRLAIGTRNFAIVGSSPESLIKVTDGQAIIHPIAGTRPRDADPLKDEALAIELLADPKERAEHLMLVDLGRNDLNKVSQPGSVKVVEFMKIEKFSHVMHIVSTITATLGKGITALQAALAVFPAGTLSGAPKVRAMEIIEEVEGLRRGIYGGAIGYLDFHGNLDTCIAIRTAVIENGRAIIQAGAGVVLDSVPELEDQETLNKAMAVMKAISRANTFLS
jgi:anthranilate synthase component I